MGHVIIDGVIEWPDSTADTIFSGTFRLHACADFRIYVVGSLSDTSIAVFWIDSATFLQTGRATESQFEWTMLSYTFQVPDNDISYTIEVYATDHVGYLQTYVKEPMFLIIIAALFFLLSVIVFFVYDYFVK